MEILGDFSQCQSLYYDKSISTAKQTGKLVFQQSEIILGAFPRTIGGKWKVLKYSTSVSEFFLKYEET